MLHCVLACMCEDYKHFEEHAASRLEDSGSQSAPGDPVRSKAAAFSAPFTRIICCRCVCVCFFLCQASDVTPGGRRLSLRSRRQTKTRVEGFANDHFLGPYALTLVAESCSAKPVKN